MLKNQNDNIFMLKNQNDNIFLNNLDNSHKVDLISLRENEEFASKLISDLTRVYEVEVKYKRRSDIQSEITIKPHSYDRFTGGILTVTPSGVELSMHLDTNSQILENLLSHKRKPRACYGLIYDMQKEEEEKLPDSGTRHLQGYDATRMQQAKKIVDSWLNKQLKKHELIAKRQSDSSCGDTFILTTTLKQDSALSGKIKFWMAVIQSKGIQIKLNAL